MDTIQPNTDEQFGYPSAFKVWFEYCESTENLIHLAYDSFRHQLRLPHIVDLLQSSRHHKDGDMESALWHAGIAQKEIESGFATLHAHTLLGLWGALECLVEDLFLEVIGADETLFVKEEFRKLKVPVSALGNQASRNLSILMEASKQVGDRRGIGLFENLLKFVGLAGEVPTRISSQIYYAQCIRNVWAHRGGIADETFVRGCPTPGITIGQRISIDKALFAGLMHAMHMYVKVIDNRMRSREGFLPISSECPGYEGLLVAPMSDQEGTRVVIRGDTFPTAGFSEVRG